MGNSVSSKLLQKNSVLPKNLNAILRNFSKCYFPVKTSKSEARITSPSYSSFISSKTVAKVVRIRSAFMWRYGDRID